MWLLSSYSRYSSLSSFSSSSFALRSATLLALFLSLTLCLGCASLSPVPVIAEDVTPETTSPETPSDPATVTPIEPVPVTVVSGGCDCPDYSSSISALGEKLDSLESSFNGYKEKFDAFFDLFAGQKETVERIGAGTDLLSLRKPGSGGQESPDGVAQEDDDASLLGLDFSSPFVVQFLAPGLVCGAVCGAVFWAGASNWELGSGVSKDE